MRALLVSLALITPLFGSESESVTIVTSPFSSTANYTLKVDNQLVARGQRTVGFFSPCTYTITDLQGSIVCVGTTNNANPMWMTLYVYDNEKNYIGSITSTLWTTARAKYTFQDRFGNACVHGYLDDHTFLFLLLDERSQDYNVIAELKGRTLGATMGQLEVLLHDHDTSLDPRIIQIFNLFVLDHKETFATPPPPTDRDRDRDRR